MEYGDRIFLITVESARGISAYTLRISAQIYLVEKIAESYLSLQSKIMIDSSDKVL
jgi:hypothetical protein